jgi:hypothetical protein
MNTAKTATRMATSAWRSASSAVGAADGLLDPLRAAGRGLYRTGRRVPKLVRGAPLTALGLAAVAGAFATMLFVHRNRR